MGSLAFVIEDVLGQIAAMRNRHEEPIRIRISERMWRQLGHEAQCDALLVSDSRAVADRLCGLPVRIDRDWDAPPVVESREHQKPTP